MAFPLFQNPQYHWSHWLQFAILAEDIFVSRGETKETAKQFLSKQESYKIVSFVQQYSSNIDVKTFYDINDLSRGNMGDGSRHVPKKPTCA